MSRRMGITLLPGGESGFTTVHGGRTQIKCRCAKISRQACLEFKDLVSNDGESPTKKKKSNSPNKRKSNAMGGYKYGIWVPCNVKEALLEDKINGNTLWNDAIFREIAALQ